MFMFIKVGLGLRSRGVIVGEGGFIRFRSLNIVRNDLTISVQEI